MCAELRAEIDKLRSQSGMMNEDTHMAGLAEIAMLREKLMSKEKEMDELSRCCEMWGLGRKGIQSYPVISAHTCS